VFFAFCLLQIVTCCIERKIDTGQKRASKSGGRQQIDQASISANERKLAMLNEVVSNKTLRKRVLWQVFVK